MSNDTEHRRPGRDLPAGVSGQDSSGVEVLIEGVGKSFGRRPVLSDVSGRIEAGQMIALTGPSGVGKTTLLNCVGALEPFDHGRIEIVGPGKGLGARQAEQRLDVGRLVGGSKRRYLRRVVGFAFQNAGLVDNWSVYQNLQVAITPAGRRPTRQAMDEVLAKVGLPGAGQARAYTLSGGESQRVSLARLWLKSPAVVLADEPMTALDQANAEVVFGLLEEMARNGATVLMATHDPVVVARCSGELALTRPTDNPPAN